MTRSLRCATGRVSPWRAVQWLAAGLLAAANCAHAQSAADACGSLDNAFGPFDYRKDKDKLPIVEHAHFTPPVEALIHGVSGPIGAELDYVLRAFPNHHRALSAMNRLGQKTKSPQPAGSQYTIDCYFIRALRFAGDDNVARMLYAQYLDRTGRDKEAVTQLEYAIRQGKDDGFTQYNVGMSFFELKMYDRAVAQAHRAMALGFDRPELRAQLQRVGKWREPGKK